MNILGIETSCDETAAAVVTDGTTLRSNVIVSQIDLHAKYGGVIPEIAARSHIEAILPAVREALGLAKMSWEDIDGIAVTQGPGLLGSLLIGTLTARTLALVKNKPLYPVNHVVAHTFANFIDWSSMPSSGLTQGSNKQIPDQVRNDMWVAPRFPLLSLSVSGGHSHLLLFKDYLDYKLLGATLDDAAGEAFDKVAKLLGLPYPGGPAIDKAAKLGDPKRYEFPKANLGRESLSFSFSGLKTAVLRLAQAEAGLDITAHSSVLASKLTAQQKNDIAASFQKTICETLVDKLELAARLYKPKSVVIAGGVAANQVLRYEVSRRLDYQMHYAPMSLCTDNAAMIASLGYHVAIAKRSIDPHKLQAESSLPI